MPDHTSEDLAALCREYMARYPRAQNPCGLLFVFSSEEMLEILKEANGREIVFRDVPGTLDLTTYYFRKKRC